MSAEGGAEAPARRFQLAEPEFLLRGGALAAIAAVCLTLGLGVARRSWLLWPLALAMLAVAALTGWAAAIQLTGGERFDDHPWV